MKKKEEPIVAYGWIKYTVKQQADGLYRAKLTDHPNIAPHVGVDVAGALAVMFERYALLVRGGAIKP